MSFILTDADGQVLSASDQAEGDGADISHFLPVEISERAQLSYTALRRAEQDSYFQLFPKDWPGRFEVVRFGRYIIWAFLPPDTALKSQLEALPMPALAERRGQIIANSQFEAQFGAAEDWLPRLRALGDGEELLHKDQVFTLHQDAAQGAEYCYILPSARPPNFAQDLSQLLQDIPAAILGADAAMHIRFANKAACRLLGVGHTDGVNLAQLLTECSKSLADLAASGDGTDRLRSLTARTRNGDAFVTLSRFDIGAQVQGLRFYLIQDATEQKSLEAQFVQSQKMQAVGQLAGGVAHDFNNLLTAISGHCDLLLLRHDENSSDYADLMQISQNAHRAAALVGQLLTFSRKKALQPSAVQTREVLTELSHLLNRLLGASVTLSIELPDGLPMIWMDPRQLEQVILNLVVNARDAMPNGGEVVISAKAVALDQPRNLARTQIVPGAYVVLTVADTGIGIPGDVIDKVFEPFFTTKRQGEGTGLGLSTVYGIIKQAGGAVAINSVAGQGTQFEIYLPQHTPSDAQILQPAAPPPVDLTGRDVVLLVEDEDAVRSFAARALQMRGYQVIEAESGEIALELLEDPSLEIDVIVSDVIMPGMDGPTWVIRALQDRPKTRVVFMSGYAKDVLDQNDMPVPNAGFVGKPFTLDALTRAVKLSQPSD